MLPFPVNCRIALRKRTRLAQCSIGNNRSCTMLGSFQLTMYAWHVNETHPHFTNPSVGKLLPNECQMNEWAVIFALFCTSHVHRATFLNWRENCLIQRLHQAFDYIIVMLQLTKTCILLCVGISKRVLQRYAMRLIHGKLSITSIVACFWNRN